MKHFFFFLFLLVAQINYGLSSQYEIDPKGIAITFNTQSAGRLGNQLIAYMNCKWLCQKYNVPFLYPAFDYSDQFMLHDKELFPRGKWESKFKNKVYLKNESDIENLPPSTLVIVPYFRKCPDESFKVLFTPNLKKSKFRKTMREMLQPRFIVDTVEVSKDKINVLVHVRTGGDFDRQKIKQKLIYKFPPHEFYISSLEKLSKHLGHKPIYAHIMTDDLHPEKLAIRYRQALSHLKNIEIGFWEQEKSYLNVIKDFFSVRKFDCLIRGDSTFTIMASLLADFWIVVTPEECHSKKGKNIVDKIKLNINPRLKKANPIKIDTKKIANETFPEIVGDDVEQTDVAI